jgi:hypothetical protein
MNATNPDSADTTGTSAVEKYEQARSYLAERAAVSSGILAVVEFGTVRAPGLSDLDALAIVEPKGTAEELSRFVDLTGEPQHVLDTLDLGAIKIVTPDQFSRLAILGASGFKKIWGDMPAVESLDVGTSTLVSLADVMDWLPERASMLHTYQLMDDPPLTRLINCIYSLGHTMKRAADFGACSESDLNDFMFTIDQLRNDWVNSNGAVSLNTIEEVLDEAFGTAVGLIDSVAKKSISDGFYEPTISGTTAIFNLDRRRGFSFGPSQTHSGDDTSVSSTLIDVPDVWLTHLLALESFGGRIGRVVGDCFTTPHSVEREKINAGLLTVLQHRMDLCNQMADFLEPRGLRHAMFRFAHLQPAISATAHA